MAVGTLYLLFRQQHHVGNAGSWAPPSPLQSEPVVLWGRGHCLNRSWQCFWCIEVDQGVRPCCKQCRSRSFLGIERDSSAGCVTAFLPPRACRSPRGDPDISVCPLSSLHSPLSLQPSPVFSSPHSSLPPFPFFFPPFLCWIDPQALSPLGNCYIPSPSSSSHQIHLLVFDRLWLLCL